jgi:hypothetical protein
MWTFILMVVGTFIIMALIGSKMSDEEMTERYRRRDYKGWTNEEIVSWADRIGHSDRVVKQAKRELKERRDNPIEFSKKMYKNGTIERIIPEDWSFLNVPMQENQHFDDDDDDTVPKFIILDEEPKV